MHYFWCTVPEKTIEVHKMGNEKKPRNNYIDHSIG